MLILNTGVCSLNCCAFQIGLPDALDIALTGKNVRAEKAKKLGLVDLLVDPLGPGSRPQGEMNVDYMESIAVDMARYKCKRSCLLLGSELLCVCVRACVTLQGERGMFAVPGIVLVCPLLQGSTVYIL